MTGKHRRFDRNCRSEAQDSAHPDAISQFQVVTSGGQAEFGRALGGYISVVTRSGANDLHGDLYAYFRNQRFNAANALSAAKLPSTQAQYGASLGGPLLRDRTFYFANFEHRALQQSGLVTISPANIDAINSRLDATGYSGPRLFTGLYPNPVKTTNALAKLDHQFHAKDPSQHNELHVRTWSGLHASFPALRPAQA